MGNMNLAKLTALLFTLLFSTAVTCIAQTDTDKQRKANDASTKTQPAVDDEFLAQFRMLRDEPTGAWASPIYERGGVYGRVYYLFLDGKATRKALLIQPSQLKNMLNYQINPFDDKDPFGSQLTLSPGKEFSSEDVGKYKREGGTLYITFSNMLVTARVNGNELKCVYIESSTNERKEWILQRIPSEEGLKIFSPAAAKELEQREKVKLVAANKFTVPADSPLIGRWKYEERSAPVIIPGYVSEPGLLRKVITAVFSSNSILEITVQELFVNGQSYSGSTERTNWKYIPTSGTSGVLEQYEGDVLLVRGDVRWIDSNKFEYTNTFHQKLNMAGQKFIYTRQ